MLNRLGRAEIDWGVNADGWEFLVTNKYDREVIVGKVTAADNVEHVLHIERHFDQEIEVAKVKPADGATHVERMEIPAGGTVRIKGGGHPWLKGWPAACAFWFKEPEGGTWESWCSIGIDVSTSILELGTVNRTSSTGLASPLEALFPAQHHDDVQYVYLQSNRSS
jgi:hypothetical protein